MITRKYGWKPDPVDKRDKLFKFRRRIKLPPVVDMGDGISVIYDQGKLGACVGHGVGSLDRYVTEKQKMCVFEPSRLMIYYEARKRIRKVNQDSGAHIRDAMKAISRVGVCHEDIWPYDVRKFKIAPSKEAYADAETHQAIEYEKIDNDIYDMKECLYEGFPFVFGATIFKYFEGVEIAKTGILKMPVKGEKKLGGHCMLCVGYNDETQMFNILNSWGNDWGKGGFFDMPYEYMEKYGSDRWTIHLVE